LVCVGEGKVSGKVEFWKAREKDGRRGKRVGDIVKNGWGRRGMGEGAIEWSTYLGQSPK
jgi:hypothetical protein